MRQLITRIDDELHARLKEKAKAEGRSMNAIVTEALDGAVGNPTERDRFLARLESRGWKIAHPTQPARIPTDEEVDEAGRGAGTAVGEAVEADRAGR